MCSNTKDRLLDIANRFAPPTDKHETLLVSEKLLYVFFSIDICDSTRNKAEIKNWFDANLLLYNELFEPMHFWKYNGDEVLYAEPFSNLESLIDIVQKAYAYIKHLQNEMLIKIKKSFRLKGAIWLAETDDEIGSPLCHHIRTNNYGDEFVGKSIDEGFRLAKKITGSKIIIDPKIVYFFSVVASIYNNDKNYSWFIRDGIFYQYARNIQESVYDKLDDLVSNIRFVGFTKLKGIWNDRSYPIFWYFQSDDDQAYDEELDGDYVHPHRIKKVGQPIEEDYEPKVFEKIFETVQVGEYVKTTLEKIAENKYECSYPLSSQAKLYYSVACINPESNRILIAKRSSTRRHLKGVWEFIPFKHRTMEVAGTIKTEFMHRLGMNINIITDGEQEQNIIPIHFCTTYRNGVGHNNLLCVACFDGGYTDEELLEKLRNYTNKQIYSDFAFVDINDSSKYMSLTRKEIENDSIKALSSSNRIYPENTATMYFANTVSAIKSFWQLYCNGKSWCNYGEKEEKKDV